MGPKYHVMISEINDQLKEWILERDEDGISRIDMIIRSQPNIKKWFKLKAYAQGKIDSLNCRNVDKMLEFFGYYPIFPRCYSGLLKDHRNLATLASVCNLDIAVISRIVKNQKKDLRIQSALQILTALKLNLLEQLDDDLYDDV
jgi:hypothetical protein